MLLEYFNYITEIAKKAKKSEKKAQKCLPVQMNFSKLQPVDSLIARKSEII